MEEITIKKAEYDGLVRKAEAYDRISGGGRKGGKNSVAKLTPEQLSARAKKAVEARIAKYGQNRRK